MADQPAARLLLDARWMAGLTQAEVASRAGVSRQTIGQYESGSRRPSLETLDRLLSGCGVRLRLSLVPEPGLDDEPSLSLLRARPLDRLSVTQGEALIQLAIAEPPPDLLMIGGKAAARLHGAYLFTLETELWVNGACPPAVVEAVLRDAGATPGEVTVSRLREGFPVVIAAIEVSVRMAEHYDGLLRRAVSMSLTPTLSVMVAGADDCCRGWYRRDLDHLALQRAVRLAEAHDLMP